MALVLYWEKNLVVMLGRYCSPVAQMVKRLPAMWETWIWSLGWEDPLEKGKATHSSIMAWRIWILDCIVHGVAKSQIWLSLSLYLPPEKCVCMSWRNSQNWTWNNGLVPNWERSMTGCILSPCLLNLYAEYIKQNAGLDEAQAGIKIVGSNTNNLRYTDDTTLMAESEE